MDIFWPGDWRPEDGRSDYAILKELMAAQRGAVQPTTPVQAIAEPADGTATSPAGPQAATTAPEPQATQATATATPAATDSAGPTPVPQPNYTPVPTSTPAPTAASTTPPAATPAQTPQQGGGNASGGCSIGDSGGTDLVLQRRFLNLVSFWPEIASLKARPQSCQARGQVAMKR